MKKLFTSESVTEGHPDKICDQISDAVLDAILAEDPDGRVACETTVSTGLVHIMGEISTKCYVDIPRITREVIRDIGYDRAKYGFDCDTCGVLSSIHEQSADILSDSEITAKIEHVHVSDFAGKYREFKALRPILHPGEGTIDFAEVFALLRGVGYRGSVTLESPIMVGDGLDIKKIEKTMSYIKENLKF